MTAFDLELLDMIDNEFDPTDDVASLKNLFCDDRDNFPLLCLGAGLFAFFPSLYSLLWYRKNKSEFLLIDGDGGGESAFIKEPTELELSDVVAVSEDIRVRLLLLLFIELAMIKYRFSIDC